MSDLAQALLDEQLPPVAESRESFNVLCAGESGLGKSTFLRDIFAHLDPTKQQNLRKIVAERAAHLRTIEEDLRRNEQEGRPTSARPTIEDDERARQLHASKIDLKRRQADAQTELDGAIRRFHAHRSSVQELRAEERRLEEHVAALRARTRQEDDDAEVTRLLKEVLVLGGELKAIREELIVELRRSNLDKEAPLGQTREVTVRRIESMPLYAGAVEALTVTLIDPPGYGDLEVDQPHDSSADKVVAEVTQRITSHLQKREATRPNLSLVDEKKYWNDLVHLCLFFISPHRMKRADVDLMKRLHTLVPLVVVIAKSDTMTVDETRRFKGEVRRQLEREGVQTFVFEQAKRTAVEDAHRAFVDHPDFEPLYGGSEGDTPWAVMGADDSRREMIIGDWETNNPRHSDLPAVRDLLLRAGGWQDLKSDAAIKAESEGCARESEALRRACEPPWRRFVSPLLAALRRLTRINVILALAVAAAALLVPHVAARQQDALLQQIGSLRSELALCTEARSSNMRIAAANYSSMQARVEELQNDYDDWTGVRKALEDDLAELRRQIELESRKGAGERSGYGSMWEEAGKGYRWW